MAKRFEYWFRFIILYRNWFTLIINRALSLRTTKIVLRTGQKIYGSKNSPLTVVMDETFILKQYTPEFMSIKKGDVVVDIGANIGDFSIYAFLNGASQVFSYEPDPDTYKLLKYNIDSNSLSDIHPIQKAISNKNQLSTFYRRVNNGGNSFYKSIDSVNEINVISVRLENIFIDNNIDNIDFLKIDCEGSEGEIFKSVSGNTLNKIQKISLEYHDNFSKLSHTSIVSLLKINHFHIACHLSDNSFGYIYAWKD